jgi:hypothetical protein
MNNYILYAYPHTAGAKNKGIIGTSGPNPRATIHNSSGLRPERFYFRAADNAAAYRYVCENYRPEDTRPLSGKSYIKPRKLAEGDRVYLIEPYRLGWNDNGDKVYADCGVISEVLETFISIDFNGVHDQHYHTRFVDFSLSEIL